MYYYALNKILQNFVVLTNLCIIIDIFINDDFGLVCNVKIPKSN